MSEKRKEKRKREESFAELKSDGDDSVVKIDADDSIEEVWLIRKPNAISTEELQNSRWRSSKRTKIRSSAGLFFASADESPSLNSLPSCSVALPAENRADSNYHVHHVNGIIRIEPDESEGTVVEDPIELCRPPSIPNGLKQRFFPFGAEIKEKKEKKTTAPKFLRKRKKNFEGKN